MITHKEYMDSNGELYHDYFGQFVSPSIRHYLSISSKYQEIIESTDPSFNDIPLKWWDHVCAINTHLIPWGLVHDSGYFCRDLATHVCIFKEAARQIKSNRECCDLK